MSSIYDSSFVDGEVDSTCSSIDTTKNDYSVVDSSHDESAMFNWRKGRANIIESDDESDEENQSDPPSDTFNSYSSEQCDNSKETSNDDLGATFCDHTNSKENHIRNSSHVDEDNNINSIDSTQNVNVESSSDLIDGSIDSDNVDEKIEVVQLPPPLFEAYVNDNANIDKNIAEPTEDYAVEIGEISNNRIENSLNYVDNVEEVDVLTTNEGIHSLAIVPILVSFNKAKEKSEIIQNRKSIFDGQQTFISPRKSSDFRFGVGDLANSTAVHPQLHSSDTDSDGDVIEISDEEATTNRLPKKLVLNRDAGQKTLTSLSEKEKVETEHGPVTAPVVQQQQNTSDIETTEIEVTSVQYNLQKSKVFQLERELATATNSLKTSNLKQLPDNGAMIKNRCAELQKMLEQSREMFSKMTVIDEINTVAKPLQQLNWKELRDNANAVQPKTFGKQAMGTYQAQKAFTLEALHKLHSALDARPKDEIAEVPKGLKVELMPHQKIALSWLIFREKESPSGGILADDMGLGKTLTMLALMVKSKENEASEDSDEDNQYIGRQMRYKGGNLVICPATLIEQWANEITNRFKRGTLDCILYHGPRREPHAKKLAKYDVVITTYAIANIEVQKNGALSNVKWRRIILDEAHQIRNHKSQTAESCFRLSAKSRWALSGTPIHNKELDMYSLLKFLRCKPFDDLPTWKRWIGDKSTGGTERLHTIISSIMLRRTKDELFSGGALQALPKKQWQLIEIQLDEDEMKVYHKILIFSQHLFARFLVERAQKTDRANLNNPYVRPNAEQMKMRNRIMKLNKMQEVNQHHILVLLLRLRQICCHPSLISVMLDRNVEDTGEDDEECDAFNLLEQLNNLRLDDGDDDDLSTDSATVETLNNASKHVLNAADPIFNPERPSSKIKAALKIVKEKLVDSNDKAVIVSQWPHYLRLLAIHLKKYDIKFAQLDGSVPVIKRMEIVDSFNNPRNPMKILLLSLTAGGVGLNLVGGNHLILLDLHWNPQLESQAQDRIYRMGQNKPVFVYKFVAVNTIEESIKILQEGKLAMSEGILTGTKQVVENKLSINDLKLIFGMQ